MNKITNWLFHWWYAKKLKEIQDLPFKMKIETDALKSNSILEIQNAVEPPWLSIKGLLYKLGIKTVQNNRTRAHRDDFGKQIVSPNPVFSENQIAEIKSKFWLYRIAIIFFCIAESFLYFLTASLFVPGGGLLMQILVAIFLALLVMLGLDYALEKHFLYREVMERHGRKEITDMELLKFKDLRNIGYVIIALSFTAIFFSGFARIFFLEYIPLKGLTSERIASVTNASKMASIFTLLITVIAALFMAMIKREQTKIGIRFRVLRSWHNAHVQRNHYTQSLIHNANRIRLIAEQSAEKHWQLVIDLKRVYRMQTEYDEKYETLHQEYITLKAQPGFVLTDDLYRRFAVIQCVYEELFKYGVMSAEEIRDKIVCARDILRVPEAHLAEHIAAISENAEEKSKHDFILPATNGRAKENQFLTH